MTEYKIILYYKYTPIADPAGFTAWHKELCQKLGFKGRVIIAHEGINGTLEGTTENIQEYCDILRAQDGSAGTWGNFSDVVFKVSDGSGKSFPKMKVKNRPEIVSLKLGDDDVNPNEITGTHLPPEELNRWIQEGEDFHIVDMRNSYEYIVGHFKGSIDPGMENFRDLPNVLPKLENLKDKKVLTVCTGGIRCEKASGYLKKKGFKDVYQLDGGIVKYMEKYPGKDFAGALYVFDDRVTMDTTKEREIVGTCALCGIKSERYINCANDLCHFHYICCEDCDTTGEGTLPCPKKCQSIAVTA